MKDQVVLAPSGLLAIAIPLFRFHYEGLLEAGSGYSIAMVDSHRPLAYVIDCGKEGGLVPQLMNAEVVERNLEFLGEL